MRSTIFKAAAAALAAAFGVTLVVLASGIATAAVSATPVYTKATVTPVAGYYVRNNKFDHVAAAITTTAGSLNFTPGASNGLGCQVGDNGTGLAAGVGEILNASPAGTFAVVWKGGTFPNPPAPGDNTFSNPLLQGIIPGAPNLISPQLAAVPAGDVVNTEIWYDQKAGDVFFYAQDVTSGGDSYRGGPFYVGKYAFFNQAGCGVVADTTGMSAPAVNDAGDFGHVVFRSYSGSWGVINNPHWQGVKVDSTATGLGPASNSLLTPGNTLGAVWPGDYNFSVLAGSGIG